MLKKYSRKILFLIALFWLALLLRSIIATLPPVLPIIQKELQLSNEIAGATTTIPLICFGTFAFVTPSLQKKFGTTISMSLALVLITVGTMIRVFPVSYILILSTFCIGVGTAIANVLFPVVLRNHYRDRIALAMGIFTLLVNLGAGIGSISIPFLISMGLSWNFALSLWSLPGIFSVFFWIISHAKEQDNLNENTITLNPDKALDNNLLNKDLSPVKTKNITKEPSATNDINSNSLLSTNENEPESVNNENKYYIPDGNEEKITQTQYLSIRELIRMPIAWHIAAYMGIQGLIYYNLMTWLPTIFEYNGFESNASATLFGIFNTIAIVGSIIGPKITVSKNYKLVSLIFYCIYILMTIFFLLGFYLALIASIVAGICQGITYTMGLTLIASQPNEDTVPSISAFSQGCGYILAAIGPVLMGSLYSLTNSWWVAIISVIIAMVINHISFIISKQQMDKAQIEYDLNSTKNNKVKI